jgi:hypothetical protein
MKAWISLLTSVAILGGGASSVSAQDIASLENSVRVAEQTLRDEPYLAAFCPQLKSGDAFFHRGRHRRGRPPVVALADWDVMIQRELNAGRLAQARADGLRQEARQRRNTVHTACNLDYWRAELARARAPRARPSAEATFSFNGDVNGYRVINGNGTLSGDFTAWSFVSGEAVPSWNNTLRARVTCTGGLLPGRSAKPMADGEATCRAEWTEAGKSFVWVCQGPGISQWGTQGHWFGTPAGNCRGTATTDTGPQNRIFGIVAFQSRLGQP